jgi:hypothetical protein
MTRSVRLVLAVQAIYYVATGIWPLLHMRSFEFVTGEKQDDWLVYTVGLLLAAIGASLLTAARLRQVNAAVCVVAFGAAVALAAVETTFVSARVISPIYLLDAAIEVALAFALAWTLVRTRSLRRPGA